jgi:hypothetical protein
VGCFILAKTGYQGDWYPLNQALDITVDPPYRHRVLFPLLARTIGLVFPSASPVGLFLGVQFIVLLALFPLTARWCGLFGGRAVGIMASLLLFPLLVLTTTYYTFYDLGIVLFYTLGLYCLATGRRLLFLAVVGLATLNHENILLLILVSGAIVTAERSRLAYDWRFVGTQLVIHLAIRGVLFYFMPETRASALGNAWINLHFVWTAVLGSPSLVDTFLLFVWFATALFGLPHAPRLLRRAVVVLPMLIGLTVLVGQLNEARQFVAFAPVAFALLVCWVRGIAVDAQPRVARAA